MDCLGMASTTRLSSLDLGKAMTDIDVSEFFVAGGTLRPNTPSYVKRPADDTLFDLALAGEFCYVLTPRQMGKSSLMVRTARRLQAHEVSTAIIDLTLIGTGGSMEEWYRGLLTELKRGLRLSVDIATWWQARADLGITQRFTVFLREVVLTACEQKVVVFIDEIDSALNLEFRDDFFAAIRAMYNARAQDPTFDRLTFVLLGVAAPTDLIADRARTPFNIGHAIPLQEFSRQDAAVLQAGLEAAYPDMGKAIFDRIYHWTEGHPYMTQKLCRAIVDDAPGVIPSAVEGSATQDTVPPHVIPSAVEGSPPQVNTRTNASDVILSAAEGSLTNINAHVDALVEQLFLTEDARNERNLKFVQDRLLTHPQREALLKLYRRVLGRRPVPDDAQSLLQNQLKLAGLVKAEGGILRVRNEIYRRVFTRAWVREHIALNWTLIAAVSAGAVALVAVAILLYSAAVTAIVLPRHVVDFYDVAKSEERLSTLARVVSLWNPLDPGGYADKAKELFFALSPDEQAELFRRHDARDADVLAVVRALYTTLADADGTNNTARVLNAMATALDDIEHLAEEDENLQEEISAWLQARTAVYQEDAPQFALDAYTQALGLNAENHALYYERARVLAEEGAYSAALEDMERVIAEAKIAAEPTPTPAPTLAGDAAPGVVSPTMTVTKPFEMPVVEPTATVTSGRVSTSTSSVVTQTVAPPEPAPGISDFRNKGYMRGAVRNLIAQYPQLLVAMAQADAAAYPNLREAWPTLLPTRVREPDAMTMVYVPAGEFQMGSIDEDVQAAVEQCVIDGFEWEICESAYDDERRVHTVALDAFWLDQTEVTNAQYARCVDDGDCAPSALADDANYNGDDYPVVGVSWNDVVAYCTWAGAGLPTEAHWEYAARGPEGRIYPWGDEFGGTRVNFCDASCEFDWADQTVDDGYVTTAPVGSFPDGASWVGALDIAGNVWEWVADWYGAYPSERQENPTGPEAGEVRVLRGGGWDSHARIVRSANRYRNLLTNRNDNVGFRCAIAARQGP
jgi:formylglycine-generating enzyme required for sulfatase activity